MNSTKKTYTYNPLPMAEYRQRSTATEKARQAAFNAFTAAHNEYNQQCRTNGPDLANSPAVHAAAKARDEALKAWRAAVAEYYAVIDQRPRSLRG